MEEAVALVWIIVCVCVCVCVSVCVCVCVCDSLVEIPSSLWIGTCTLFAGMHVYINDSYECVYQLQL